MMAINQKRKSTLALLALLSIFSLSSVNCQSYFPPNEPGIWETVDPDDLGWCIDKLNDFYTFLDTTNTKGFIILHKGKIAAEKYFNGHDQGENWYWASAGKSLASVLMGIAQDQDLLDINDPTSKYLGTGWTSLPPEKEKNVTIWHHLTFTTGFDNKKAPFGCFDPYCFQYLAEPGERWFYQNGTYTIMHEILHEASGMNSTQFTQENVLQQTGMDGFWLNTNPTTKLFWSTTRSMSRFGLMVANQATWNGVDIIKDKSYVNDMLSTSQDDNPSYGYLWWLHGKDAHHLPGLYFRFNRPLNVHAPSDMVSGLGKDGQFVEVIPSMDLVIVRMGESAGDGLTAAPYHREYWQRLNEVFCNTTATNNELESEFHLYPNPARNSVEIISTHSIQSLRLYDLKGRLVRNFNGHKKFDITSLKKGIYHARALDSNGVLHRQRILKL